MAEPKLRIRASGYGGSGYTNPITGEKVIGVTTALGALDKPGVTQWAVDQTVMYLIANLDMVKQRSDEQIFKLGRFIHTRGTPAKFDNPEIDANNYHDFVLNDLADLGTSIHDWVEEYVTDGFPPDLIRDEQVQMAEAFLDWLDQHDVKVVATEMTVFGDGYGGTLDLILEIDGVTYLTDVKTSRAVRDTHIAQLAAYGAASMAVVEVPEGTEGAVEYKGSWFADKTLPGFQKYAIVQIRPDDYDPKGNLIPAFCKMHVISQEEIDAGYLLYLSAQNARLSAKMLADARKEREKNEHESD